MHGWGSRAPWTPFMHPVPKGGGGTGSKPPKNLPPLTTTSIPNFVPIRPAIWIPIESTHPYRQTLPFKCGTVYNK